MTTTTAAETARIKAVAARITRELLDAHGLTLAGWSVKFNRAKRAAGSCDYSTRTITLSTITHEIAHALTRGHGHDFIWSSKHRELGGDGKRCFVAEISDDSAPWVAQCAHGVTFHRYRAPKPGARFRCRCREGASLVVFQRNTERVDA